MALPYTGQADSKPPVPKEVLDTLSVGKPDPRLYRAEPDLAAAVNVALLLGQPLLLTGDPGTGKTLLAYHLALELGLDAPLKFDTKTTSTARDLLYRFDGLRRLQDAYALGMAGAHAQGSATGDVRRVDTSNLNYIEFGPLGKAIVLGQDESVVLEWMARLSPPIPEDLARTYLSAALKHTGTRKRSIVLVDEIDKAPRDFPNDLLNEIEEWNFRVPELGFDKISCHNACRPILVLTSNTERNLPPAFLRRCVFYHIEPPTTERLAVIARLQIESFNTPPDQPQPRLLTDSLAFFEKVRGIGLERNPGTAEFLNWLRALLVTAKASDPLIQCRPALIASAGTLAKSAEDLKLLKDQMFRYLGE